MKSRVNRARQSLKRMLLGEDGRFPPPRLLPKQPAVAHARQLVPTTLKRAAPVPVAAPVLVPAIRSGPVVSRLLRAHLTEIERLIVRTEVQLTRYRKIAGHPASACASIDAGGTLLDLAERHLADLNARRQRLFEAG